MRAPQEIRICDGAQIKYFQSQNDAKKWSMPLRLGYCNSVLSGCTTKSLKILQLIQNTAAHVLTGTWKQDHISPVLASQHWLPVKSSVEFKVLLLTYKVLNGQATLFLKELIVPLHPIRMLRSQNAALQVVPRISKSNLGGRAFSYQALILWN